MKNSFKQVLAFFSLFLMAFSPVVHSQTLYKINESKDIDMKLSGTSTLHKWTMDAKTFSGEGQFVFKQGTTDQLASITTLNFSLAVQDLKSGESALDKNAYKALKSDQYKDILYKLASAKVLHGKDNQYLLQTQGSLTIAGVTKEVAMDVDCTVNKDAT